MSLVLSLEGPESYARLHADGSLEFGTPGMRTWTTGRVALQETDEPDPGHVWPRQVRSICEQFPGRFTAERISEDTAKLELLDREHRPVGTFVVRLALNGVWIEVEVIEVDPSLKSLGYPPPVENDELVIPLGVGRRLSKALQQRHLYSFYGHLNMRFFGGLSGEEGYVCVFDEGFEDAAVMSTGLTAAPFWLRSLGTWKTCRKLRYRGFRGGHVQAAQVFREFAAEQGLLHSIRKKMEDTPALKSLVGGRILSFMQAKPVHSSTGEDNLLPRAQWADKPESGIKVSITHCRVRELIEWHRSLGVEKAVANVRGWIRGGYDESHPDIWPPEESLGTLEELFELCRGVPGVVTALHDNYQDIYRQCPSFPDGVIRDRSGALMAGGIWAGGQAYILDSRAGLRNARRNWADLAMLEPVALFPDTVTAVRLYENWDPHSPQTRAQDLEAKTELLRFYRSQGLLVGSEESADFGPAHVGWLENRHHRDPDGQTVPLWPLVFHDCVLNARYGPPAWTPEFPGGPKRQEVDMLWGYPLLWGHDEWPTDEQEAQRVRESLQVDRWIARVGAEPMTDHRWLDDEHTVERTEFGSAGSIIVNFGPEEATVGGHRVPGHGHVIEG